MPTFLAVFNVICREGNDGESGIETAHDSPEMMLVLFKSYEFILIRSIKSYNLKLDSI